MTAEALPFVRLDQIAQLVAELAPPPDLSGIEADLVTAESEIAAAQADADAAQAAADAAQAAATAAQGTASAALPKAGGAMTGKIVLDGDPTAALHPATRQYVLNQIAVLINGAPGALDTLKEIADQLGADEAGAAALAAVVAGKLTAASNLADLVNVATARANLGLGSAATHPAGDFEASGAVAAEAALRVAAIAAETAARVAADALAVPKSLADAKGDIFVATADDTPDRLPVGANGQVLTADSAQAKGVKWAAPAASGMPVTGYEAGLYYPLPESTTGQIGPTLNELRAHPFVVTKATTFDRIACEVTTPQATGLVRLGIYADNGNGAPGALILDAGTVSAASNGLKAITINQTLPAGVYWLGAVIQGIGGVNVRSMTGQLHSHSIIGYTDPTVVAFSLIEAMVQAGVAGALPSPFVRSGFSGSGSATLISLRAA